MRKLFAFIPFIVLLILATGCDCPKCPECQPCNWENNCKELDLELRRVLGENTTLRMKFDQFTRDAKKDTTAILLNHKAELRAYMNSEIKRNDSIINELKNAAFLEATIYRDRSIYQVDTMRANYLEWCADTLHGINAYFDSLKGTVIYDNLIIEPGADCDSVLKSFVDESFRL